MEIADSGWDRDRSYGGQDVDDSCDRGVGDEGCFARYIQIIPLGA